jgi:hypothetical protein
MLSLKGSMVALAPLPLPIYNLLVSSVK